MSHAHIIGLLFGEGLVALVVLPAWIFRRR